MKKVKKYCIDKDTDISDFIEKLLEKNIPKRSQVKCILKLISSYIVVTISKVYKLLFL